jgi:glycosyltransferase involved in cell wall biosynthesis
MIEAMACGTPVIAFRSGSVSEVIDEGISGLLVETLDQAVAAAGQIESLDRTQVRAAFERRFTVERMARDYVGLYQALITSHHAASRRTQVRPRWRMNWFHLRSP